MKNDTTSRPKWRNQSQSVNSAPKRVLAVKMNNFFEEKPHDQDTGTWPLKGSKRRRPRPLTATLAKPRLLDITLLGKIDMSLMRKELLSVYRLMRMPIEKINMDKKSKKKKDDSGRTVKSDVVIQITEVKEAENAIIALRKEKSPFKLFPCSNSTKRSKGKIDVAFSGPLTGRPLAKPCDSCGRASRPERLHAHPPKVSLSPARVKASPRPAEDHAERVEPVVTLSPIHHKHQRKGEPHTRRSQEKVDDAPPLCSFCGRRFGTTSLPIHEAKCRERREEKSSFKISHENLHRSNTPRELDDDSSRKLSSRTMKVSSNAFLKSPRKFDFPIEKDELSLISRSPNHRLRVSSNTETETNLIVSPSRHRQSKTEDSSFKATEKDLEWETHLQSLIKCNVCGRGFAPERVLRHQSICIGSSKRSVSKSRTRSNNT